MGTLQSLQVVDQLVFEPARGLVEVFGERALVLHARALFELRARLLAELGEQRGRAILERTARDYGRGVALVVRRRLPDYWGRGRPGQVVRLLGQAQQVETLHGPSPSDSDTFLQLAVQDSVEASEHLAHHPPAATPVCWALTAFTSGFVSAMEGREIVFLEEECQARGDGRCRLVGRAAAPPPAAIGPNRPEPAAPSPSDDGAPALVAESPAMARVLELTRRAAASDAPVLLSGESGVGKDRVARLLHTASPRAERPLLAINCAAIPGELLESELFGHARGAFTGADRDRTGLLEAIQGGTLFLDEVGEMAPAMQAKLLRALEDRRVRRLGEVRERPFDARIVSATNLDLRREVASGRFRADLYYRLRVIEIPIPPLRERPEDLEPLAHAFLAAAGPRGLRGFTPAALEALRRHRWPGNARELRNAVERAVALAPGPLMDVSDLPAEVVEEPAASAPGSPLRPLAAVEREHIEAALVLLGGDKPAAAEALGIGLATLYRRLKEYRAGDAAAGR